MGRLSYVRNSMDFYPRPPRGGRPANSWDTLRLVTISIHALREEGDLRRPMGLTFLPKFLSTPSARRATEFQNPEIRAEYISIHALREEGDTGILSSGLVLLPFLSTPSARRATGA